MKKLYLLLIQFSFVVLNSYGQSFIAYNNHNDSDLNEMGLTDPSIFQTSANVVEEGIEVFANNIHLYLDEDGEAVINAEDIGIANYENEDVVAMDVYPRKFSKTHVGRNSVELIVKTSSGRESSSEAIVTVLDNLPPVAKTKNLKFQLGDNQELKIQASDIDDGSYDNSNIKSITIDKDSFTKEDIGANMVTLTVEDIYSNKSTAISVVIIEK